MAKSRIRRARSNIRQKGSSATRDWASLRLRDRIRPGVRVLFVGINPGVRSATVGHHFAGPSNRFWKLLYESGLVSEPIGYEDDDRLGDWGYGITNLVARASPGIDDLRPAEYPAGWRALDRKIRRHRPAMVALVGVTLYRALLPLIDAEGARRWLRGRDGSASACSRSRFTARRCSSCQIRAAEMQTSVTRKCWRRSGNWRDT